MAWHGGLPWGLYSPAFLRDPPVISAISWFILSSFQMPTKSWVVGIGALPMSHTDEVEARQWTIPLLPMFLIAQSRSMDAHVCTVCTVARRGGLGDGVQCVPTRKRKQGCKPSSLGTHADSGKKHTLSLGFSAFLSLPATEATLHQVTSL